MKPVTVALCMIVKNEEDILPKTFPQFNKLFDEIIVVDTGSSDNTKNIIKSYGVVPVEFEWVNDFAKARNESIKNAKSDWIVWLDADEYINDEDFIKLKDILSRADSDCYSIKVLEAKEGGFQAFGYLWRDKVFKNHCGLHFEREINEGIFDSNSNSALSLKINVEIYHLGGAIALSQNLKRKAKKEERNIKLYNNLLKKNPKDFRANMLLGKSYLIAQKLNEAYECFKKASEYAMDTEGRESNLVDASFCSVHLGKYSEAKDLLLQALKLNKKNAGAACNLGLVFIKENNPAETIKLLEAIIDDPYPKDKTYSVNMNYYTYQRYVYLAQAYLILGNVQKALEILEKGYNEYGDENLRNLLELYKKKTGEK